MNAPDRVQPHPGRRGDGHGNVLLARAGAGRPARPAQRPLLARHRDVRDGRRPPAVQGRQPGRHRLQAGPRPPAAAEPDHQRHPAAVRGDRGQAAGQGPRIRYPTAEALRDDLRRFRNGDPVQALAAAPVRSRHAAAAARRRRRGRGGDGHGRRQRTAARAPAARRAAARVVTGRPLLRAAAVTHRLVRAGRLPRPRRPRHRRRAAVQRPVGRRRAGQQRAAQLRRPAAARGHRRPRRQAPDVRGDPPGEPTVRRCGRVPHRTGRRDPRRRGTRSSTCTSTPSRSCRRCPTSRASRCSRPSGILSAAGFQIGQLLNEESDDHPRRRRPPHRPAGRRAGRAGHHDQHRRVLGRDQVAVPANVVGLPEDEARRCSRATRTCSRSTPPRRATASPRGW